MPPATKKPAKKNWRLERLKESLERPNSYDAQKLKQKDDKVREAKRI